MHLPSLARSLFLDVSTLKLQHFLVLDRVGNCCCFRQAFSIVKGEPSLGGTCFSMWSLGQKETSNTSGIEQEEWEKIAAPRVPHILCDPRYEKSLQ